ncbi:MAG: hypothetical protein CTY15_04330 [Methylocystis sp.]|nr:MAG: hypothetical protein CTY15_04330 [Methylocystis sp.]
MSDKYSIEFTQPQTGGHPHDLLARLYREIGISAVAAALEASQPSQKPAEPVKSYDDRDGAAVLLGDDLAA